MAVRTNVQNTVFKNKKGATCAAPINFSKNYFNSAKYLIVRTI